MKFCITTICFFFSLQGFSQSISENEVLKVSADIFKWEVENKIDSVATVLHPRFIVVGFDGSLNQKSDYIKKLSGNNFKHNSIEIIENKATILREYSDSIW